MDMGEVTVARGSSSLTELVRRIQEVLDNYGSSVFELDTSIEILSRTRLDANLEAWKKMPEGERPVKAAEYEGLLEDDNNRWFAVIQVNT
jgi:hypothetical protein